MRLICGFLRLDGCPAEGERLDAMAAAMVGPGLSPSVARRIDGPVALAMLDFASPRSWPAAGGVPAGESGLLLAADIRLDEPDRLAGALGGALGNADGSAGTGRDDGLLLSALERWGQGGVGRVLGDFAFAAWDPRSRSLLCARDAMGVRPFFFLHRPGEVFAFASLPRGLHAGGFAARELDEEYLLGTLLLTPLGPERSFFRGMERLAPGGLLRVSAEGLERNLHWQPDAATAGRRPCRPEEAAEELAALLAEAVRCRLPAAGPVATHLSGGLDSSAVTVLAARMLRGQGRPLYAYSFLPRQGGCYSDNDERPYIDAVLRQEPDIDWTPIHITDPTAFVLPRLDPDQPYSCDPATPEVQVCADAAARGAGILLTGWGGDEGATFHGGGALAEAFLAGRWRTLAREVRALEKLGRSPMSVVRGDILPYLIPDRAERLITRLLGRPPQRTGYERVATLLRPGAVARVSTSRFVFRPDAVANRLAGLTQPGVAANVEKLATMGARYGLAVAFPMLDRRLVAFVLSLPSDLFVRDGWRRRLFRDAMAGVLPSEIRWRPDKLAAIPEQPDLVLGQRDALLAQLPPLRRHPRIATLFDLDIIEERLRALPSADGTPKTLSPREVQEVRRSISVLWRVLCFAIYVQQHHGMD